VNWVGKVPARGEGAGRLCQRQGASGGGECERESGQEEGGGPGFQLTLHAVVGAVEMRESHDGRPGRGDGSAGSEGVTAAARQIPGEEICRDVGGGEGRVRSKHTYVRYGKQLGGEQARHVGREGGLT
jgi:hypothetical protein